MTYLLYLLKQIIVCFSFHWKIAQTMNTSKHWIVAIGLSSSQKSCHFVRVVRWKLRFCAFVHGHTFSVNHFPQKPSILLSMVVIKLKATQLNFARLAMFLTSFIWNLKKKNSSEPFNRLFLVYLIFIVIISNNPRSSL